MLKQGFSLTVVFGSLLVACFAMGFIMPASGFAVETQEEKPPRDDRQERSEEARWDTAYLAFIRQYMEQHPDVITRITISKVGEPIPEDTENGLIVPAYQNEFPLKSAVLAGEEEAVLQALVAQEVITGGWKSNYYLPAPSRPYQGVLVLGLGSRDDFDAEKLRGSAGAAVAAFKQHRVRRLFLDVSHFHELPVEAFVEAVCLGQYTFDAYKKSGSDALPPRVSEITLIVSDEADAEALAQACETAVLVSLAANGARHLANTAANDKTPVALARTAEEIAAAAGSPLTCIILEEDRMAELGMGSLLGVAQGSEAPPRLIFLEYRHPGAQRTVALVGKGITFDSGGISLKSGSGMHQMKYDMCGGAAVISTMMALSHLKPAINVIGVVPAVVNMPDGRAQTPGDVVRAYNGKTIEVWNTDAEGRMILADALAYTIDTYQPDSILDVATLTGAATVALGKLAAAVLGTDDALINALIEAGEATGERLWRLPLWSDYDSLIEGNVADLNNIGTDGQAGTIIGAAFLKQFVGDTPWAHLDIAAVAYGVSNRSYLESKYATGFGVRLLTHWILAQAAGE